MKLRLGTRGSDLALRQAEMAQAALEAAHPGLAWERVIIKTIGDQRPDLKLTEFTKSQVVDKGIFTKELEIALTERRIDLAVHSLKDVPTEMSAEYALAAVLPREDTSDVLVTKTPLPKGLASLPKGAKLATSAVRRQAQLRWLRPDLDLREIRGNVPTRLRKLWEEDLDGVVLAVAGLKRLGIMDMVRASPTTNVVRASSPDGVSGVPPEAGDVAGETPTTQSSGTDEPRWISNSPLHFTFLIPPDFLPACGQGAIALQIRANDLQARKLVTAINHQDTMCRVLLERAFLLRLQAGCHTPVGIDTRLEGNEILAWARVFDEADLARPPRQAQARGPRDDPEGLADELMRRLA